MKFVVYEADTTNGEPDVFVKRALEYVKPVVPCCCDIVLNRDGVVVEGWIINGADMEYDKRGCVVVDRRKGAVNGTI